MGLTWNGSMQWKSSKFSHISATGSDGQSPRGAQANLNCSRLMWEKNRRKFCRFSGCGPNEAGHWMGLPEPLTRERSRLCAPCERHLLGRPEGPTKSCSAALSFDFNFRYVGLAGVCVMSCHAFRQN